VDDPGRLPNATYIEEVPAPRSGYLKWVDARVIGEASVALGAGRAKTGDPIDHAVGIVVLHKVGDRVKKGEPLFSVHASEQTKLEAARVAVLAAHLWSAKKVKQLPLFYGTVK
jgi:pyrimidine-nucleoside phosphorylase